jgi:hypothetical protein
MLMPTRNRRIVQNASVEKDLDRAMKNWSCSISSVKMNRCWKPDSNMSLGLDLPLIAHQVERRFAFVDAPTSLGFMLEFLTDCWLIQAIYAAVHKAAENWDGTEPVRPFTP